MKSKNAGLYIHIPFCRSKCPYCDFYSLRLDESAANVYTDTLIHRIPALAAKYNITADTVYIGGGTPSALGAERLGRIIGAAREFSSSEWIFLWGQFRDRSHQESTLLCILEDSEIKAVKYWRFQKSWIIRTVRFW